MYGEPITSWSEGWREARKATLWHVRTIDIVAHLQQMIDTLGETGPECPTCWASENEGCLIVGSLHVSAKHTHVARQRLAGVLA